MANIEVINVLMTSVPRSTACDGQRDRFGNKGSILEGRLIRAGSGVAGCQPSLGLSDTMGHKRWNALRYAARLRFLASHTQKSTLYRTIQIDMNTTQNDINII